jgi:hypothetical protein
VLLLQEKFEGNGSIGLLSESLLSSLILGNDNEVEIQIK